MIEAGIPDMGTERADEATAASWNPAAAVAADIPMPGRIDCETGGFEEEGGDGFFSFSSSLPVGDGPRVGGDEPPVENHSLLSNRSLFWVFGNK